MGSDKEEGGKWPYCGAAGGVEAMGAKHVIKSVNVSFFVLSANDIFSMQKIQNLFIEAVDLLVSNVCSMFNMD